MSKFSGVRGRARVRRPFVGRLCLILALAGSVGGAFTRAGVAAAYESCRSDPVLVVNGATIDVFSTLQTAPSSIRELDYTVTVPAGSVLGPTRLTVGIGFPEKVTYVQSAAQRWGTVRIAATVQAQPGVAAFPTVVQATALTLNGLALTSSGTASGLSTSIVTVSLGNLSML